MKWNIFKYIFKHHSKYEGFISREDMQYVHLTFLIGTGTLLILIFIFNIIPIPIFVGWCLGYVIVLSIDLFLKMKQGWEIEYTHYWSISIQTISYKSAKHLLIGYPSKVRRTAFGRYQATWNDRIWLHPLNADANNQQKNTTIPSLGNSNANTP